MILYILYRIGVILALYLPLKMSYCMASVLADIYCAASPTDRMIVTKNLAVVLNYSTDDVRLKRMTRGVFINFAKYLVDFFRFSVINEEYVRKNVKIEGSENIKAALAKGKGAIMLSAHIGNWEMGAAALSLSGYPINAVVLTHQNKKINDFFTRQRLNGKFRPIEIGASLRACYTTLKNNGLLALLGDRDFTKNGVEASFFGRKTLVPRGPAVFAFREGAALLPTFITRQPDDTFSLVIDKPIYADRAMTESVAIADLVQKGILCIESCIRRHPTQWYVFKNIWETNDRQDMRPDTII